MTDAEKLERITTALKQVQSEEDTQVITPDSDNVAPKSTKEKVRKKDDISPQGSSDKDMLGYIKGEFLSSPFMTYFEHCATRINISRWAQSRCIYQYRIIHPRFYRYAKIADFFTRVVYLIVILIVFLKAFSIPEYLISIIKSLNS